MLGADKAYDVAEFVADLREYNVTPMWHTTPPIGALRSTAERRATPAMRSVDGCASPSFLRLGQPERGGGLAIVFSGLHAGPPSRTFAR